MKWSTLNFPDALPVLDGCHVYRIASETGDITRVASDHVKPNGLAFSPDEKHLYIADTGVR